jgi:acyl phosphate:glycerol-3-phosphate acyltransferase
MGETALALALSYLLGSIPTGAIAGRVRGVDLRKVGSGNLGFTNALRALGPPFAGPVLVVDVAKGTAAVLAAGAIAGAASPLGATGARLACGLAAIVGHVWSVFARFRGGRGVATACGVFLALSPLAAALCIVAWGLVVAATRYVSLGSIVAAVLLPFAVTAEARLTKPPQPAALTAAAALVALLVVVKHRPNMQRLIAGTEHRLGRSRE